MIRVLHVLPTLKPAGAESLVLNIIKNTNLKRFSVSVCVLFPPQGTHLEVELNNLGVPSYYLGKRPGLDLKMIGRLSWVYERVQPDVVHTHNYVMRYTLAPTALRQVPVRVHTVHNIAQREVDTPGKIVHWLAFNFFDVVPVSISRKVAKSVESMYGVLSPVIYNGIPLNQYKSTGNLRRNKKSDIVFINVAWFRPQKNHQLLIDAFSEARKRNINIKLYLVGDGPLRAITEKVVKEKKLMRDILFLGLRNDIPDLLRESDVFISSSKWEGFGLTIVEAMAAGKPVIATAVDGVPEIVIDQVTGILVPTGNVHKMASAILELAENADLRSHMGKKARTRAFRKFDISGTTEKYQNIYVELLRKRLRSNPST